MFLPWTLLTLNAFLTLFRILVVGGLGGILAIYSRYGGQYANSIRWARQGGYLEIYYSLFNSRHSLPNTVKMTLLVTILASLIASLADKGLSRLVKQTEVQRPSQSAFINTTQHRPLSLVASFTGWSTAVRSGSSIVVAMSKLMGNSKNIPSAVNSWTYIPQTSAYEVECSRVDLSPLYHDGSQLTLPNNGCAQALLFTGNTVSDYTHLVLVQRSTGRWSISVPQSPAQFVDFLWLLMPIYKDNLCSLPGYDQTTMATDFSQLRAFPRTIARKCVYPTGDITITTATSAQFTISSIQRFREVSTNIFDQYEELFNTMEASLNNQTHALTPMLLAEIQVTDSGSDILICKTYLPPSLGAVAWKCMYLTFSMIFLKPQTLNADMAMARQNRSLTNLPEFAIDISVDHLPSIINDSLAPYSIAALREATVASSHYLASLGQNFYQDYNTSQLYVQYDTTHAVQGIEFPDWLLGCVIAAMSVGAILWGATEFLLPEPFTSSLYKNIGRLMSGRVGTQDPMLMRFDVHGMKFEDVPLITIPLSISPINTTANASTTPLTSA
ncbi:hypothetical protein EDD11_005514 [Mortierella claussenii]|nr:hypothetical protein EDD11_005514 [Mortierella claussenii]